MERDDEDLGQEIEIEAPEVEESEAPARRAEADDGAGREPFLGLDALEHVRLGQKAGHVMNRDIPGHRPLRRRVLR